jgi:hypothetical protein
MNSIKRNLSRISFFDNIFRKRKNKRQEKIYSEWLQNKKPLPMPHYGKQKTLLEYAKKYNLKIMLETGTYRGDMIYAAQPYFDAIYSIELGKDLYEKALERLSVYKNVHLLLGNSGDLLPRAIKDISQPCLFWLDAHYSGGRTAKSDLETPIMQELASVFAHPLIDRHVILIDDARCFTEENDYPSIDSLKEYVLSKKRNWILEVKDDIIRVHSN